MLVDTILTAPTAMALITGARSVLIYNDAYRVIVGSRHPAAFGKPVAEGLAEIQPLLGIVARVRKGETVSVRDQRMVVARNGADEEAWFDLDYSAVRDAEGKPQGTLIVAFESARQALRETEDTLREVQKTATLGQLTRGVAHDFNNLLQGIMGSLELVRKLIGLGRAGETEKFIESAMSATRRAAALTQRLLTFSGPRPAEPKPVDVNALLGAMDELLQRAGTPAIKIRSVLSLEPLMTVCDASQFEHAILNLVFNARDAMQERGTIAIQTSNVSTGTRDTPLPPGIAPGEYVCVAVTDSGPGLSADALRRIADSFIAPKPDSAGLGLSLVNRIVRKSNGYVKVDSEIGRGTTVGLYLPRYS